MLSINESKSNCFFADQAQKKVIVHWHEEKHLLFSSDYRTKQHCKWLKNKNSTTSLEQKLHILQFIALSHAQFDHRDITHFLMTLAKWPTYYQQKIHYQQAINSLVLLIPTQISSFSARDIAHLFYALGKWPERCEESFFVQTIDQLITLIPQQIHQYNSQNITHILSVLVKWPHRIHQAHFKTAIDDLIRHIADIGNNFNPQSISNVLNVLSKWPERMLETHFKKAICVLFEQISLQVDTFNSQDIAISLNAISKLLIILPSLAENVINLLILKILQNNLSFTLQGVSNISLALCLFKMVYPDNLLLKNNRKLIKNLLTQFEGIIFQHLDQLSARQLFQVNVFEPNIFSKQLKHTILSFIPQFKAEKLNSSNLQKDILNQLKTRFKSLVFQSEYFVDYTHVDIAWLAGKLIIQVNGPCHYVGKNLNLSSQFNTFLLEKLGWKVLNLPYYEWNEIVVNDKKNEYLEQKLKGFLFFAHAANNSKKTKPTHLNNLFDLTATYPPSKKNKTPLAKKRSIPLPIISTNSFESIAPKEQRFDPDPSKKSNKKAPKMKKNTPKRVVSQDNIWQQLTADLIQIRPDELEHAYTIFKACFESIKQHNVPLTLLKKATRDSLYEAVYPKTIELFAPKTLLALFQKKPFLYGLRLNNETHPEEAFAENKLKTYFFKSIRLD